MNCPQASLSQDAASRREDKAADGANAGGIVLRVLTLGIVRLPPDYGARVRHFSGCDRTFSCWDEDVGWWREPACFEARAPSPAKTSGEPATKTSRETARQADWAAAGEQMLRSQAEAHATGVDRTGPRTWDLLSDAGVTANCRLVTRATYVCDSPQGPPDAAPDVVPSSE